MGLNSRPYLWRTSTGYNLCLHPSPWLFWDRTLLYHSGLHRTPDPPVSAFQCLRCVPRCLVPWLIFLENPLYPCPRRKFKVSLKLKIVNINYCIHSDIKGLGRSHVNKLVLEELMAWLSMLTYSGWDRTQCHNQLFRKESFNFFSFLYSMILVPEESKFQVVLFQTTHTSHTKINLVFLVFKKIGFLTPTLFFSG